jgi:hypothetical protein
LAWDKPTIRLPIEQMDRRRRELLAEGRKVGAWMTGKSGWNCVKYVWMHIFYHLSEDSSRNGRHDTEKKNSNSPKSL